MPKLKLGYESDTTPGRRKLLRQGAGSSKRRRLNEEIIAEETLTGDSKREALDREEILPEAICEFNVVKSQMVDIAI